MNKKHTVSLCMIVYNEESCLHSCLESVKHLIDEMIIVDTGSTDQTLSLAQQAGAKIFSFPWQDNFALARNFSLLQASGDWILVLDADEVLEPCSQHEFEELLTKDVEGYFLPVRNKLQDGNLENHDYVVRLFRNRPGYRFEGALHEQIVPSILRLSGETSLAHAPISIMHYGYLPEKVKEKEKFERNRRILVKALAHDSNNPFYLYCLGLEYLQQNNLAAGIPFLETARDKASPQEGYYSELLRTLALCYLQVNDLPRFFSVLEQHLRTYGESGDLHMLYALGHLQEKKPLLAIQNIRQALEIEEAGETPACEIFTRSQCYSILGEGYFRAGSYHDSIEAYLKALKSSPTQLYPLLQILSLCQIANQAEVPITEPLMNEPLFAQIANFAPPNVQGKMAKNLCAQGEIPLALLLNLCAFYQIQATSREITSPPDPSLPDLTDYRLAIQQGLKTLRQAPQMVEAPVPSSSSPDLLRIMEREFEAFCLCLQQFPREQDLLAQQLPRFVYELFALISFHYLPYVPKEELFCSPEF